MNAVISWCNFVKAPTIGPWETDEIFVTYNPFTTTSSPPPQLRQRHSPVVLGNVEFEKRLRFFLPPHGELIKEPVARFVFEIKKFFPGLLVLP